ncbi:hypothetical protein [Nonomuraea gerenzanensis]|uniref:Uncharacterized protein n=1 Tax=Nonomuraea gerenzanensis TaxID=93944 RepID=A0A1M4EMQ2_9ACTN|nr:hypothetical protein [Nonomuraea gerenzanensis]UBU11599.1 hypothetical protein LCN96_46055 [Nonomuraea gerenzanensis]SBP00095.1 hypothetical protein BN4615_P9611 [Nonomuraea gerenzanensis]
MTADLGEDRAAWSTQTELLAQVRDLIAQANWLFASAHRGRGPEPPRPEPLPRPFDD